MRGTLMNFVQYQSLCGGFGISCVISNRSDSDGRSPVASPMRMTIFVEGRLQLLGYTVPIKLTSPRDRLKPKVVPAEGWHYKEFVGSEEGKESTMLMICQRSENLVQCLRGRSLLPSFTYIFRFLHNLLTW